MADVRQHLHRAPPQVAVGEAVQVRQAHEGVVRPVQHREGTRVPLDERALVAQAHADKQGLEADTVRLFWRLAARFAGDMTLAFLATGGVTFSGGVLPRLIDFADPDVFRARFEDKAPFGDLLRRVSTRLIMVDDAVLSGLGGIAARPDDYAINYPGRAWC